jgi:PAS domain S-box-containing protein
MRESLKILLLEDSAEDAEEIMHRLRLNETLHCTFLPAKDKAGYLRALDEFEPSLILSDHSMPQFDAREAFILARQRFPGIPFIVVSGAISDEYAIDMLKMGVDDYLLKDRMTRLPAAILTAVQRQKAEREKLEAEQRIIRSETNLRAIFENTSDGFVLLDGNAVIMAFNTKAAQYLRLGKTQPFQAGHSIYEFIEEGRRHFFRETFEKAIQGEIVQYERSYEMENDRRVWIDFCMTPVLESGQVKGVCVAGRDITGKKILEQEIMDQKVQEQKNIARAILEAQEKERNSLGQELHDNVNQILATTQMLLSMAKYHPEKMAELILSSRENIGNAIEENRKIARGLVAPDFKTILLRDQLEALTEDMLRRAGIHVITDSAQLREELLAEDHKLVIYRIAQEQCTNIIKHAQAGLVYFSLNTVAGMFRMIIFDNGKGVKTGAKTEGIGLRNIRNRLSIFNGTANIRTNPGKGFALEIEIPIGLPPAGQGSLQRD